MPMVSAANTELPWTQLEVNRSWERVMSVAKWVDVPEYSRWKIDQSVAELKEEKEMVKEMLG